MLKKFKGTEMTKTLKRKIKLEDLHSKYHNLL